MSLTSIFYDLQLCILDIIVDENICVMYERIETMRRIDKSSGKAEKCRVIYKARKTEPMEGVKKIETVGRGECWKVRRVEGICPEQIEVEAIW